MEASSKLARRVDLEDAWEDSAHSDLCALIYPTQNGWKIPILFEELGQPYDWALVDFERGEQKTAAFKKINPNARIPALLDRAKGVSVAESGAILEYIADRYPSPLMPSAEEDLRLHLQVKQWLYWQVSGLGPAMGQAMYFQRIAKVSGHDDPYAIARFVTEAKRCLSVLDAQLAESGGPFVLGPQLTLVDVACFPYSASAFWANIDISDLPALRSWIERLHARPSFAAGLKIPFARPAFFGPPYASEAEIRAEIERNAAQFR